MTTPEIRAACDKLREDAGIWSGASDALRTAARSAESLTLADKLGVFAQFVGVEPIITEYDTLRQKVAVLLAGGDAVLGELSTVLNQAADTYEREDIAGAHRVAQAGADR